MAFKEYELPVSCKTPKDYEEYNSNIALSFIKEF